ncbi:uncharacterized protein K452DRAFT_162554 [Aplosporella prunicola CBS 121167]|uniref:SUN domain-containing protein n=1 Tax=Aplosporella prunicola CBS 121167 TaxID=1176127 RepID=A0A6A6BIH8_9PEZI|nr:uncharacterized protein K452DRAFT_162554 [Aplosporella prunicola CBS 121167]KAF2143806.1 hypothetical protein K452DRAFT_162554 [Aplosporella prunicola CBS 121167]
MARATPSRRSERIASRSDSREPSIAPSDAGGVGRLADSSPAKSHAYGSRGRASVARELNAPVTSAAQTLGQAFAETSVQNAASQDRSAARTAVNQDRSAVRPAANQDRSTVRTTASQDRTSARTTASQDRTTARTIIRPDRSNHTTTDQDRSETIRRLTSRVEIGTNRRRQPAPQDDYYLPDILEENQTGRPATAGSDARSNSSVADKSYATQREAGFFKDFGKYLGPKDTPSSRSVASKRPETLGPRPVIDGRVPEPADREEPPQSPVPTAWATVKRCAIHTLKWLYRWINVALVFGSKFFGAIFWLALFACFVDFCCHRTNPYTRICKAFETISLPIIRGGGDNNRVNNLYSRVNGVEKDLEDLLAKVPQMIVLEQDPVTGEAKIPERFWDIAHNHLDHEKSSDGVSVSWNDFWKKNEGRLQALLSDQVSSEVKKALANDAIVDKATFQKMLEKEYTSKANRHIDKIFKDFQKTLPQQFGKSRDQWLAKEKSTEWLMPIIMENTMLDLRSYNFFSATTGATVIQSLTSPTYARNLTWSQWLYTNVVFLPSPNPALVALQRWEEAGDCWCTAATSSIGKAQIGIKIPQAIYPTKLTVEHVPQQATLDTASAPKKLEVWFEVNDEIKRNRVRNAYREISSHHDTNPNGPEPPGENYVFVGSYFYDVSSTNFRQTFPLDVSFANYNIATNKAVVRVTENHGREWTCLYRLRLHGHLAEEQESGH